MDNITGEVQQANMQRNGSMVGRSFVIDSADRRNSRNIGINMAVIIYGEIKPYNDLSAASSW
jgi:hypothetical protein